jgi:hypothetical protein
LVKSVQPLQIATWLRGWAWGAGACNLAEGFGAPDLEALLDELG